MRRSALLLCLSVLVSSCGGEEDPVIPDVSGSYNLVAHQRDSDCLPEVADSEQVWGFMTEAASGIRVMTVDISQDVGELSALLGPSSCEWTGVVDAMNSLTLSGDCHEGDIARSAHLATTISPYGGGWELLGTMALEIDTQDGEGAGGPDGVPDCEVMSDIEGTGG